MSGARRRREEGCRREEAIRGLLKRHGEKRLTIVDVEAVAWELGVSRSTMYRLIIAYRAKGTVSSVEPQAIGRRKDALCVGRHARATDRIGVIQEIYLKPERPTMAHLIEQVRARCARKGLPLPDRRTIKARVDRIDRRTVALKRKDAKSVKATKAVPGNMQRPGRSKSCRSTTPRSMSSLLNETTRKTMDKRPWLTLAIDVFTRLVVGFHLSMDKPSRISLGLCMLIARRAVGATRCGFEGARASMRRGRGDDCPRQCIRTTAQTSVHAFAWACRRGHQVDLRTHRRSPLRRLHRAPDRTMMGRAFLSRIDLRQS